MRLLLTACLAMLAAPAWASELSLPIEMMEAVPAGPVASPDATPAERAFGLMQRGDWVAAREAAEPLADAGDAAMAALMARLHGEGLGTVRDTDTALRWMERAAEAGNVAARHDLAVALLTGSGIERDEARALKLLRALRDEGQPEATYDLAQALLVGDRPAEDRREGEAALRAAAGAGLPQALYALARFIDESVPGGVSGDGAVDALTHLVAASRAGLPEAQLELGVWLATGRAGVLDEEAARTWLERAARAGLVPAMERLVALDGARRAQRVAASEGAGLPGVRWQEPRRTADAAPKGERVLAIDPVASVDPIASNAVVPR